MTKKIGAVLADRELIFEDHNRKKGRTYTYYIVAVDEFGDTSPTASITIKGER